MVWLTNEPHLDDVLRDPIVGAVMARDGVKHEELRRFLDEVGRTLEQRPATPRGVSSSRGVAAAPEAMLAP